MKVVLTSRAVISPAILAFFIHHVEARFQMKKARKGSKKNCLERVLFLTRSSSTISKGIKAIKRIIPDPPVYQDGTSKRPERELSRILYFRDIFFILREQN
jgi:hypothetical protein